MRDKIKKVIWFLSFLFFSHPFCFFPKKTLASLLFLPQGGSKTLKVSPSQDIYVSNGKVIKVKDFGTKILVLALKKGLSHVVSGNFDYKIQILDKTTYHLFKKIQSTIRNFMGLKVKIENSHIIVYGELLRFSDWKKISEAVLSILPLQKNLPYFFQASLDLKVDRKARQFFSKKISDWGRSWPPSHLNLQNYSIELPKEEEKNSHLWTQIFHPYGLSLHFSKQKILLPPMVKVQIYITEINKSWQRQSGVKWPDDLKAHIFPLSLSKENLFLHLQALENKGEGQILASPNLICQSGSEASFLSGGEFPIKTFGYKQEGIVWKSHGVILNIRPLAKSNGSMKIDISAEVSLLDHANSIGGVPALKTNRISSHFNLKKKTTLALSGLILQDAGHSSDQTPYINQIPFLGRLFQSKSFREQKSELVIFVTPEVLPENPS